MNKINLTGAAVLTAAILSLATTARAENLNKSFTSESFLDTTLNGTTVIARPELAGPIIEDVTKPFTISGNVSGTVQNRVVREIGGTLDFYWRVAVDADSTGVGVSALRIGNFGYANIVDADWRIDGLGTTAPTIGRVFNPASVPEGDINFVFSDLIKPGDDTSRFFFLHTDATSYDESAQYDLTGSGNGDISDLYSTFAPAKGVPDGGSSLVLLSLGLLSLGALARRR